MRSLIAATCTVALSLVAGDLRAQGWEGQLQPEPVGTTAQAPSELGPQTPPPASSTGKLDVELAGEATYVSPPIRGGANPFGAGFGGRFGLVWSGFYVGISVIDFLGEQDVDVSYHSILYGADVGYGLHLLVVGPTSLTLRPMVGVGVASVDYTDPKLGADVVTSASGSSSRATDTLTVSNVFLRPGVKVLLASGAHFAALDGNMLMLPGIAYGGADATTWLSYGAQLEVGLRF